MSNVAQFSDHSRSPEPKISFADYFEKLKEVTDLLNEQRKRIEKNRRHNKAVRWFIPALTGLSMFGVYITLVPFIGSTFLPFAGIVALAGLRLQKKFKRTRDKSRIEVANGKFWLDREISELGKMRKSLAPNENFEQVLKDALKRGEITPLAKEAVRDMGQIAKDLTNKSYMRNYGRIVEGALDLQTNRRKRLGIIDWFRGEDARVH